MVARGEIEPPTRGFSVTNRFSQHQLHQPVSLGARCNECPTMQDRTGLIHAKLPQKDRGLPELCGSTGSNRGQASNHFTLANSNENSLSLVLRN
jgi:hypothetical protein